MTARQIAAFFAPAAVVLWMAGCAHVAEPPAGGHISSAELSPPRGDVSREKLSWENLPGWRADDHAAAMPAFLRGCEKLRGDKWRAICAAAASLPAADDGAARRFFENYFAPRQLLREDGGEYGLITGYYEPLLRGAEKPDARHRHPIYARPADLLKVSLGALYPQLQSRRARGRLSGGEVVPYYSRAEIDGGSSPLAGEELLWVDDKYALFFLHIQGSGLVRLPDGRIVGVGYSDQNGHPYRSIGRLLIERGEMTADEVNLFSLREWLHNNPHRADALLNDNPSYVFFAVRDDVGIGPIGALGATLTPERSMAADFSVVPRGAPVWIDTTMPDDGAPLQKLMFAQDSGGAIKGAVRADFFWGRGDRAEKMAGLMKERGRLFVLMPK